MEDDGGLWRDGCGGREGHGALTGEAVEGAEDTVSTPAGRGRGGMKTVAGAAAALCCAGAEARVRSPGAERRMLAAGAALARKAGGGGRRRGEGRRGTKQSKTGKTGSANCERRGGTAVGEAGSPERRRRARWTSGRRRRRKKRSLSLNQRRSAARADQFS